MGVWRHCPGSGARQLAACNSAPHLDPALLRLGAGPELPHPPHRRHQGGIPRLPVIQEGSNLSGNLRTQGRTFLGSELGCAQGVWMEALGKDGPTQGLPLTLSWSGSWMARRVPCLRVCGLLHGTVSICRDSYSKYFVFLSSIHPSIHVFIRQLESVPGPIPAHRQRCSQVETDQRTDRGRGVQGAIGVVGAPGKDHLQGQEGLRPPRETGVEGELARPLGAMWCGRWEPGSVLWPTPFFISLHEEGGKQPRFPSEERAQSDGLQCPRSHSHQMAGPGFRPASRI